MVHRVLDGPYHSTDVLDGEEDEDYWFIEAIVESRGELVHMTICHEEYDKIYNIVKHLSGPTVEPFIFGETDSD